MKKWFAALVILALLPLGCAQKPKELTAEEMVRATAQRSQSVVPIAQGVAQAYGDYLSFARSGEEFATRIAALSEQYEGVKRSAAQFRQDYVLAASEQDADLIAALQAEAEAERVLDELLLGSAPNGLAIPREEAYEFYASKANQILTLLQPLQAQMARFSSAR